MMNFLIVDDNAPMRRMIRAVIEDLAGEINECGDGADAVANTRRTIPTGF